MSKLREFFIPSIVMVLLIIIVQATLMSGQHMSVIPGAREVPYSVYMNITEQPVVGFQAEISYPSYLIYKQTTANDTLPNATVIINNNTAGLLKIAAILEQGISPEEKKLFDVIFDVSELAPIGNYSIDFSNVILTDINTTIISTEIFNGSLMIVAPYNITFLPPISAEENFTLQLGATLPLKFNVSSNSSFVTDNSVLVRIYNQSLGIDKTYNASGTGPNGYIKINATEQQYHVNIDTNVLNMQEGIYEINVKFSNFQKTIIRFELVNKALGIGKGHNS